MQLLVDFKPPIAIVTLNRKAKFNALSNALRDDIENAFTTLAKDDRIKAVVLTHSGPHFCVGYDLEEVIATELASFQHRPVEYHCAVYLHPKPVIGAYSGFVLAGGFDLALGADYIVSGERAVYGHPEIKFGAPPLVVTLARKIGPAKALELIWKADNIPAKKALIHGFVNEIRPDAEVLDRACAVAKRMAAHDPAILRMTKNFSNTLFCGDVRANLQKEFDDFAKETRAGELLDRVRAYYNGLRLKQGPAQE